MPRLPCWLKTLFCSTGCFAIVFFSYLVTLPSTEMASSWNQFYDFGSGEKKVYEIQVSDLDPNTIYIATNYGLHQSTDGEALVDQLITIGSPHEGAYLLAPASILKKTPIVGKFLEDAFFGFVDKALLLGELLNIGGIDINSVAVQQVVPDNEFLNLLNQNAHTLAEAYALYGDIDARLKQKIFFWDVYSASFSLGDGYMTPKSASALPVEPEDNLNVQGFSDQPIVDLEIGLAKDFESGGYKYEIDALGLSDLRFKHSNLIKQPEVVAYILDTLMRQQ